MTPAWVLRLARRAGISMWLAQAAAEARSARYAIDKRPVLQKAASTWATILLLIRGLLR
jgi:hypothetical protein